MVLNIIPYKSHKVSKKKETKMSLSKMSFF